MNVTVLYQTDYYIYIKNKQCYTCVHASYTSHDIHQCFKHR